MTREDGGHELRLFGRERLSVSGVLDVAGFDEETVALKTELGELLVRGEELHVERIDLDAGELLLHGRVRELSYEEPRRSGSFLARLFG